jgi:1-acyl-sn-glycerol-3-phosphate acyltransferase
MLYEVGHAVLPPVAKLIWRPTVEGLENIPATGPVLVAANHLSFADSVVLPIVVPRKVVFLAKEDYFTGTGIKGTISRVWFESLGCIPVDRDNTTSALASLDIALQVLERGEAFGIYPEGARSRDGRLYRGRTGMAQLALTSGAPILPVGLVGTDQLQPIGSSMPRLAKVTVRFGTPITVGDRFQGMPAGKARRELTDEVMTAIQALSGQEPAGVYNERTPTA